MREFIDYMKGMLDSQRSESYTRCAGFTTLYFYLLWATYKVSGGVAIKDIDIPPNLALFLFGLYGVGELAKRLGGTVGTATKEVTDATAGPQG